MTTHNNLKQVRGYSNALKGLNRRLFFTKSLALPSLNPAWGDI